MLNQKILNALNDQMIFEMYSANIYLSMATWFDEKNLSGFANWMKVQYQEEMFHATKFYNYINDRGGRVLIKAIDAPATEWASPLAIFENALEHEQLVTKRINKIAAMVAEQNDFATANVMQWFVTEQVEEESNVDAVIQQLKLMEGAAGGLFMLDRELAQRVYTPPPTDG